MKKGNIKLVVGNLVEPEVVLEKLGTLDIHASYGVRIILYTSPYLFYIEEQK